MITSAGTQHKHIVGGDWPQGPKRLQDEADRESGEGGRGGAQVQQTFPI